jgi:phosphatidylglycerophosphate synthase
MNVLSESVGWALRRRGLRLCLSGRGGAAALAAASGSICTYHTPSACGSSSRNRNSCRSRFLYKQSGFSLTQFSTITTSTIIKKVPNIITSLRIVACPFLTFAIANDMKGLALCGCAAAGLSDWLDGYVARKYDAAVRGMQCNAMLAAGWLWLSFLSVVAKYSHLICVFILISYYIYYIFVCNVTRQTPLGAFLDPLADKVFIGSVTLGLAMTDVLPPLLAFVIIGRDVILISGSLYLRTKEKKESSDFFDISSTTFNVNPSLLSKV